MWSASSKTAIGEVSSRFVSSYAGIFLVKHKCDLQKVFNQTETEFRFTLSMNQKFQERTLHKETIIVILKKHFELHVSFLPRYFCRSVLRIYDYDYLIPLHKPSNFSSNSSLISLCSFLLWQTLAFWTNPDASIRVVQISCTLHFYRSSADFLPEVLEGAREYAKLKTHTTHILHKTHKIWLNFKNENIGNQAPHVQSMTDWLKTSNILKCLNVGRYALLWSRCFGVNLELA